MQQAHTEKIHPTNSVHQESYYDIFEDWALIESSFLKQYGIRLRDTNNDMSYQEFVSLLGGLMEDTPLGRIVAIRSEKDMERLKNFTPEQKKIRNEWILRRNKKLREDPNAYNEYWYNMQKQFKQMFYKK